MKHKFLMTVAIVMALFSFTPLAAQDFEYKTQRVTIPKGTAVQPKLIKKDFQPKLEEVAPPPGGKALQQWLIEQKKLIPQQERKKNNNSKKNSEGRSSGNVAQPILHFSAEGNFENFGIPCDNDIAISNNGILLSVINSNIMAYDSEDDTLLFSVSLEAFADTLGLTANMYDPKAIYDPLEDRFIMVWLSGTTDSTSNIVVAFSTDADPREPWHLYALPGDPVQDGTWSDFPSVAITENELFISINALINDTFSTSQIDRWKFLFKETGLWQINKASGYTGQNLDSRYWNDFYFDNKAIRNLYPVKGGVEIKGPDIFFLSNRSFELENDTIYLAYLNAELDNPGVSLSLEVLKANPAYGLPPDAVQYNGRFLQTNDARVLGGFMENGKIHYVQNTVHPDSGTATVYHGVVHDIYSNNPTIEGHIFKEGSMEFGYPNISFTGLNTYDEQAIISFNHVSRDTFAGFSVLFYKAGVGYSDRLSIKTGSGSIGALSDTYSRWGDYTGSQRKFDEPGKVWLAGYYALSGALGGRNRAWIAGVQSPDSSFNVGVNEAIENKPFVKVFPNPVSERFNVEFELNKSQKIQIALFDIQGKLMHIFWEDGVKQGKHNFSFSLRDLSSGQYIIQAKGSDGRQIFSEKIIHY
ncbi:MAG: T9SS type A sorting domain-containing protein [Chitinophagales bacterium]